MRNAFDYININPNRRSNDTHRHDEDDDDAKPDWIISKLGNNRIENGNGEQDEGQGIYKAASENIYK